MNAGFTFLTDIIERRSQRASDRTAAARAAAVMQPKDRPVAGLRRPTVLARRRVRLPRTARRLARS